MVPHPVTRTGGRGARILRNTVSNSVGRIVTLVTSLVMTPVILHALGEAAFGIWVLATVLVGYGALLDLGMGSAIIKHVADARAREDVGAGRTLIGTATRMYSALAVVALAVGALVAGLADRVVDTGGVGASTTATVVLLVTVSFAITLALTPANAALRGLERYDLTNAITVVSALVTAGLTLLVLQRGGGLVGMVAVTVPVTLVSQVTTVLVLRRLAPDLAVRWSPVSRQALRELLGFGTTLTVSQLAVLLQKRTSELVVASSLSAAAVAPFALARRVSELPHMLVDQFVKVLLPVASALHASGEPEGLRRLYLVSSRITMALMVPLALVVALLAADLLELWVGEQYRDQADVVVILVVASVAYTSQWPAGAVFQGIGRFGWFAVFSLVSGVLTVTLAVVLVRTHGLVGVAVATLVPTVLEAFGLVLPYTLRHLGVPVGSVVRQALVPALLPAVPCVATLVLAGALVDEPTWGTLVGTGAVAVLVYVACFLAVPAAVEERALASRVRARLVKG